MRDAESDAARAAGEEGDSCLVGHSCCDGYKGMEVDVRGMVCGIQGAGSSLIQYKKSRRKLVHLVEEGS